MSEHIADHAADGRRTGGGQNDGDDVEIVFGPRVDRGSE